MDQRLSYTFGRGHLLNPQECTELFTFNDLAAIVCSVIPEEALAQPWAFTAESKRLQKTLDRRMTDLKLLEKVLDCAIFSRVHGDCFLYMVVKDGAAEEREPLRVENVSQIRFLRKVERPRIMPMTHYMDPDHEKHGQPETYMVTGPNAASVEVHETRLIKFWGARTADQERVMNAWFHHSVLQRIWEVLRDFGITWAAASRLVTQSIQGKYKLQGLAQLLSAPGVEGRESLSKRVAAIDEVRGMFNSLIMDAEGEDFTYEVASFTSLPELLDRFANRFAAASGGIPVTKLFGVSPAGMNATGESDQKNWDRILGTYRRDHLTPPLRVLLDVLLAEQGKALDAADISWPEIGAPSKSEAAAIRLSTAQSDAIYLQNQVLSPQQVAQARFVREEGFDHEIEITPEELAEAEADRAEAEAQALEQVEGRANIALDQARGGGQG